MAQKSTTTTTKRKATTRKATIDDKVSNEPAAVPIIASARPALADESSALMRRLPSGYSTRTVEDMLSYMVGSEHKQSEAQTVKSLKNELGAAGSVIVINGRNAKLTDKLEGYLVDKTKDVGGKEMKYRQLEIEISAVQQGGYRS